MGLLGFLLLVIGGSIVLYSGTSIALDPVYGGLLITFINSILGPPIGDQIVSALTFVTSIGGILVIIGAIIWYAAGSGTFALIGRIIVAVATFAALFYLVTQILGIVGSGLFSQPIGVIIAYFLGPGLGIVGVAMILIGDVVGAGRKKKKPASDSDTSGT
ncbi:MAG: hypothetical protein ACFE9O_09210 [Promethearchaeota archaeon]